MKIITHPGQAHRDEALAVGLLLAELKPSSVQLLRRDPTPAELDDPDVWVIDVGMRHEPTLHNFDHHQLPSDAPPTCSMTQVAEFLGLAPMLQSCDWYHAVAILDSKGPDALAQHFGISHSPPGMISPFETTAVTALGKFSGDTPVHSWFVRTLRFVGEGLLEASRDLHESLEKMRKCSQVLRVGGMPTMVHLMSSHPGASRVMREEWMAEHDEVIGLVLSYNDRSEGWSIFRPGKHPGVDCKRLLGHDAVSFVHSGGFLAVTKERLPLGEVLNLAAKVVSPLESP